ncbi:DNA repair exonuclease SbcCD nuclease subunit [Paucidesulfovibrio gracilis DSM 16080]|uniref:DNA repair exonuclease SbcCD nuclease subunit n=1 Tax=Paucidesulfovibrio gracilis DSM 16080 TaxID=1121449 RepID=A0A1T4XT13_9BACT|nr:metallophosphoesterase [Paucidesulfovibrio gracilis]SKA92677.1 DNA repair exonuclease SbcCD nuclease subunit [Paucidesulfovibrio gracilis DSM 16080]
MSNTHPIPEQLPRVRGNGLFLIGDPHVADIPPGHRLPGYREQVLSKLAACLDRARELEMPVVLLGDLFHRPRDNSNTLLVELMSLFRPHRPFVLVGNHDKHLARWTRDVSLAVLGEAGVIRLMQEPGLQFVLETPEAKVVVGATPDGHRLPRGLDREYVPDEATVLWFTHHNISFPDFLDRAGRIKELPGIDWLINGHIHRPQPQVQAGSTTWANPGNITRLTFSRRSSEKIPAAAIWTPGCEELTSWQVPHEPFYDVFPRQEFPPEEQEEHGESRFLEGLERLAMRRSSEGTGLREFLQANLNPEQPESALIWALYKEVVDNE